MPLHETHNKKLSIRNKNKKNIYNSHLKIGLKYIKSLQIIKLKQKNQSPNIHLYLVYQS